MEEEYALQQTDQTKCGKEETRILLQLKLWVVIYTAYEE